MREGGGASRERLVLGATFVVSALRYWLIVFPAVDREIRRLRQRAGEIPDPAIRSAALAALDKRGNIEGAAAFATLAPRRGRRDAVRALVSFQAAYNYTDTLAERPSAEPAANARRLHEALLVALDPGASHLDYYEHNAQRDDGGYLIGMLDSCRSSLEKLPSYPAVGSAAGRAAARIVAFQGLSVAPIERDAEHCAESLLLRSGGGAAEAPGEGLAWWETMAASGSSLAVHALIAAAADGELEHSHVLALEGAYFPWVGALHSLLDSLVDQAEDTRTGQLSLVGCYPSETDAAARMAALAVRARVATRSLRGGETHVVLLGGMVAFYAHGARASASTPDPAPRPQVQVQVPVPVPVQEILDGVLAAVGPAARAALAVFKARSLAARLVHGVTAARGMGRRSSSPEWCDG